MNICRHCGDRIEKMDVALNFLPKDTEIWIHKSSRFHCVKELITKPIPNGCLYISNECIIV